MRLSRIYHPESLTVGHNVVLTENATRHVGLVLRMKENDRIILFNGDGCEYLAVLSNIQKRKIMANIIEKNQSEDKSSLHIHLLQGLSKSDKMDWVIQKAVELGVTEITPLITEYCAVKYQEKKLAHWQSIIISSAEQCGRNCLPILHEPQLFHAYFSSVEKKASCRLIFDPRAQTSLTGIQPQSNFYEIMIGPEGGFSEAEIHLAKSKGMYVVKLGQAVLRTETAAIAAVTALQVLHGDFR